jgi:type I restriction enzyme S subunit
VSVVAKGKPAAEKGLVPRLRFPEFGATGWKASPLGSFATFAKGAGISKADLVDTGGIPCIRYGELYTTYGEVVTTVVSRTGLQPKQLVLSKAEDVIVPTSGETKEDIATAACITVSGIALGGDLTIIRSGCFGPWLSYYINGVLRPSIAKVAQGNSVVHLYPQQLAKVRLALPCHEEQQKIADCLASLDDRIAAETRRLDALKTHKQGLLQQLFPRQGETIPQRRLAGFNMPCRPTTLAGEARFLRGAGISKADVTSDGPTLCIRYGELYTTYSEVIDRVVSHTALSRDSLVLSEAGDVIVPTSGETKEDIATTSCVLSPGIALGGDLIVLRSSIVGPFLSYYVRGVLRDAIAKVAQGDSVVHLYPNQLGKVALSLPEADEQQKIADCLTSLDDLINAQARKIALLKQHKRGLMQQLFPSIGGVDGAAGRGGRPVLDEAAA